MRVRRLLIVGWDGAEPSLIGPMLAAGRLPNLARLQQQGAAGRLRTCQPDSSLAAWTAALTGLGPGRHGLIDFVRRPAGGYQLQLVDARQRLVPTLLAQAARGGRRVAALGVPGTWPPEPEPQLSIAGFDSPLATRAAAAAYRPAGLYAELARVGLSWPYGGVDELAVGPGWHRRAERVLHANLRRKRRLVRWLERCESVDLLWIVFSESDTAAHHFWAFADPRSPRHRRVPALTGALERIYTALDAALGELLAGLEPGGTAMVMSDHGACGAAAVAVHINRWLAGRGWLRFAGGRRPLARSAGGLRDRAGRWLPAAAKQAILRSRLAGVALGVDGLARFGGLDLAHSRAFCDELPQNPGIWIHRSDRDPSGTVPPGPAYEALRDAIAEALLQWRDPLSGRPVVARVRRREEVLSGPAVERAPDLMIELARWDGYRLVAADSGGRPGPALHRLARHEHTAGKGSGTSGAHAADGILVAAGPQIAAGAALTDAHIEDIAPTALRLLGLEPPAGLDGAALHPLAPRPAAEPAPAPPPAVVSGPNASAAVRRRLERLGYL